MFVYTQQSKWFVASCQDAAQNIGSGVCCSLARNPLELLVDQFFEACKGLRAADHAAINEKGRCAADSDGLPIGDIAVDRLAKIVRCQARVELRALYTNLVGDGLVLLLV